MRRRRAESDNDSEIQFFLIPLDKDQEAKLSPSQLEEAKHENQRYYED